MCLFVCSAITKLTVIATPLRWEFLTTAIAPAAALRTAIATLNSSQMTWCIKQHELSWLSCQSTSLVVSLQNCAVISLSIWCFEKRNSSSVLRSAVASALFVVLKLSGVVENRVAWPSPCPAWSRESWRYERMEETRPESRCGACSSAKFWVQKKKKLQISGGICSHVKRTARPLWSDFPLNLRILATPLLLFSCYYITFSILFFICKTWTSYFVGLAET